MKWLRYTAGSIVIILVVIQFIPNELPPAEGENQGDLIKGNFASPEVAQLLKNSCYNCHSNETRYPWYSYVAPVSWLVAADVRNGRDELNFSTWTGYDATKMLGKLDDIGEEVGEGDMPLPIYTFMHPSARLDDKQREMIVQWAEGAMDKLVEDEEASEEGDGDEEDQEQKN